MPPSSASTGIRANLFQFALLALINAFVGCIVGAQRSILPIAGSEYFGLASATAVTAFVASFGVTKACMNLIAGGLADRFGRRPILVAGWIAALPIPALLLIAQDTRQWWLIVAANLFLGVNQGLCWTMTIVMKTDLAGPQRRGLAVGINECAGYTAVAVAAFAVTLFAASAAPMRGVVALSALAAAAGLLLSAFAARETHRPASAPVPTAAASVSPTHFQDRLARRARIAASQAGLICNLNDAVIWTTLPPLLALRHIDAATIGLFAGVYPATWGLAQLFTGWLSDRTGRAPLIIAGMLMQGAGHFALGLETADPRLGAALGVLLLGIGTALAYPVLIAFAADHASPANRSAALGSYRFFRDMGYAAGALAAGLIADAAGLAAAIHASGVLTVLSGLAFYVLLRRPRTATGHPPCQSG